MTQDELDRLPSFAWMPSRIPKRKALITFLPDGSECPPDIKAELDKHPASRWYPESDGHRLCILYEGGAYDTELFRLEADAWDHEDCDACGGRIASMELCHVTQSGPYIALCEACYDRYVLSAPTTAT